MDNYYTELFTVIVAVIALPIYKRPTDLVTRFSNLADDFAPSIVPAAGVCDRSVVRDPRLGETKLFPAEAVSPSYQKRIKSILDEWSHS